MKINWNKKKKKNKSKNKKKNKKNNIKNKNKIKKFYLMSNMFWFFLNGRFLKSLSHWMRSIQNKKDWQRELSNCEIKEERKRCSTNWLQWSRVGPTGVNKSEKKKKKWERRNDVMKKKNFLRAKGNVKSRSKV